ncbi:MAG TPA: cupin domain-containing protein [Thermoanaerobaculia bacterium]|nr:cupin domain-containing protein [Thermoanaerobaculia bacterium]HUM29148.1 cupin domain-containing protein [Thermoanaerobaculia bacterium]HXK67525.1 cupin domain-containing protein [Thermoanaerobaculia bacterium]
MSHPTFESGSVVSQTSDLIQVQPSTIVSRTIIKKQSGTVTLFAFDQGQELSEHTAPFDALVHVLEGTAEVIISGTAHTVTPGESILMPAHAPHALRAITAFKMLLAMVRV